MSSQPTKPTNPLLPLPLRHFERITIRQLSQLPAIDLASLDPVKRKAEEARRQMLLAQAEGRKEGSHDSK